MAEHKPSRGVQGALVKLWRGGEYVLTVTGLREEFSIPRKSIKARAYWVA
jgi:hypothetical protein